AGEVFGFRAHSIDSAFGAATTTISNFSAPAAVPVPAAVWLFGSGLMGLIAMRKKPSHLSALPA
ncbi:MAG: PEP-CTERM sorting domain-containing protein, partial [Methylococcales bacterium]